MLLKTRAIFVLFCILLFVISYIKFVDFYLPARSSDPLYADLNFNFTWKNFIVFNFSLKLFFLVLKFCVLTLLVKLSSFLFNYEGSMRDIFRVIVISEFVFFLSDLTTIFWLQFIMPDYTLREHDNLHPLSLYSLMYDGSTKVAWGYLLQKLNLFEVSYIITASALLVESINKPFPQTLTVFASAYIPAIALWIFLIEFFNIGLV